MRLPLDLNALGALKLCLAVFCTLGLFPSAARAVDPNRRISQYGHTAWRLQDGVFTGPPTSITQTGDGYLWIGTTSGLFRFDGERFTAYRKPSGERLTSEVRSLLTASDGSLWFASGGLVEHLRDGHLLDFSRQDHGRRANAVVQATDGTIWATYSRQPLGPSLCRIQGQSLKCLGTAEGVSFTVADALAESPDGALWVAGHAELGKLEGDSFQVTSLAALQAGQALSSIEVLSASADGSMWVGMKAKGPGLGLQHVVRDQWSAILAPGFDSAQLSVTAIKEDRHGSLWIGTDGDGLYRVSQGRADHYNSANGLSSDSVTSLAEDREGDIWVGTVGGLDKFRDLPVSNFSLAQGLQSGVVSAVLATADGSIWSSSDTYLEHIQDGRVTSLDRRNGLPGGQVTSLLEDHLKRLWVGVDDKLYLYASGKFTAVNKRTGDPINLPFDLTEDTAGTIWAINPKDRLLYRVSTDLALDGLPVPRGRLPVGLQADKHGGLWVALEEGDLAYYKNGNWSLSPSSGNGRSGEFTQMAVTDDGSVIGSSPAGLVGWRNGTFRKLGTSNGLPCQKADSAIFDRQGTLWAYTECGLLSIRGSELRRWWEQPNARLAVTLLDSSDGAIPGNAAFRPRSALGADGTVWFANERTLQQVNPSQLDHDPLAPPVYVEGMVADRKRYVLNDDLQLPPLSRDVEIDYTALSFPIPDRVRFRYRLEGWDKDWQDASTRRQAFYTNLRPGSYRFHVIACNGDGVWNERGASFAFTIAPRYYQTAWFQIMCSLLAILLAWSLYLLRLRQATARIQERLGARLEERERIARELHDTLLQGVQGLMLRFQGIMKTLPADQPTHKMMNDALDRADELMQQARQGVKDIRAAGMRESDLPDMIRACAEELQQDHTAAVKLTFAGTPRPVDVTVCTETYRIAREAMTNAFQHSGAPNIEVEVTYQPDHLRVSVRDDGQGIEPRLLSTGKAGHWGLSGMRERAEKIGGRVRILSQRAAGTEVELTVPGRLAYARTDSPSFWDKLKGWTSREDHR